jgi:FdhD protein
MEIQQNVNRFPVEHRLRLLTGMHSFELLCTPESLRELVYGFLYNCSLIETPVDVKSLELSVDLSRAAVRLRDSQTPSRAAAGVSSWSGQTDVRSDVYRYRPGFIRFCADEMEKRAVKYARTGGVHCAALFNGSGVFSLFEDVSRRAALDKLAGDCLLRGVSARDAILVTTARISTDMVEKAERMGISVIATFSIPTEQAYERALRTGLTLIVRLQKRPEVLCGFSRIERSEGNSALF